METRSLFFFPHDFTALIVFAAAAAALFLLIYLLPT